MTRHDVVNRALSAAGQGAKYELGAGGTDPKRAVPWNEARAVDCSGFACWALGIARMLWLDTWRIAWLASGHSLFHEIGWLGALPGDALVWPDRTGTDGKKRQGHIGIVTVVGPEGPLEVCHASAGNYREHTDAIRVTSAEIFAKNGAIVVRCSEVKD